jgi:hypothetical protein
LQERVGQVEQRIARLRAQIEAVQQQRLDEAEAAPDKRATDPRGRAEWFNGPLPDNAIKVS